MKFFLESLKSKIFFLKQFSCCGLLHPSDYSEAQVQILFSCGVVLLELALRLRGLKLKILVQ